jgi:hypothetical protein
VQPRWPQAIMMISGAALIFLGVVAIGFQLSMEFFDGHQLARAVGQQQQSITVSPKSLQASTRFVGLELILVGALLEIVGYLATLGKIYRHNQAEPIFGRNPLAGAKSAR